MANPRNAPRNDAYRATLAHGVRAAVAKAVPALDDARFDDLTTTLFDIAGSTLAALVAKDPPRRTIACKAGCNYCCHLYVQVTPLEAIRLARAVLVRPAPEVAAIRARIAAADAKTRGMDATDRNILAVPCPVLEDGKCSAYADRPLVCRGANSADVNACRAGMGSAEGVPLPTFIHQRNVYAAVGQGAVQGLNDAGLRPSLLELIAALAVAIEHTDPLAAWRSGALDFAPARCLEASKSTR